MHKGARFYRCDFQVHTPRDRNWQGTRPTSEAERQQWAVALVSACRQKALDAIAITDHHDLVMFPYVRAAAEAEEGADGQRLPAEQRLVVFPGIEVTLALPCQVLVLFDADLPLDHLAHLPGALGYEPAAPSESTTAATTKLALAHPNEVIACLEKFSYLKGRFIVLPHVQENGHKTFLRSGFDKHYIAFQGVGGYVDGDAPDPKTGARKILDGLDPAYGRKPLAILQTSDNRHADHSLLGRHSTWVKWSRPTAEAIRQSCLARQSRVSQVLPQLPAVAITRIEVSASKFLGKQNVFLSPQYNALIGGRGTGKSTLLEYARWALCAITSTSDGESNSIPDYERRSRSLIEHTLTEVKGAIRVHMDVRGVPHLVERRTDSPAQPLVIKVGTSEFRPTDESEVRRLLPVEAYSQKQLSSIGGTPADVLRFVLTPVAREVASLDDRLARDADSIRAAFVKLRAAEHQAAEVARIRSERESLTKQRDALQLKFASLDPQDAAALRLGDGSAERAMRDQLRRDLEEANRAIGAARAAVKHLPSVTVPPVQATGTVHLGPMHAALSEFLATVRASLDATAATFANAPILERFRAADSATETALSEAQARFTAARARSQAHETAIQQVEALSKQVAALDSRLTELARVTEAAQSAASEFQQAHEHWLATLSERSAITASRCNVIEQRSHLLVRGHTRPAADLEHPLTVLADVAKGSRLRTERFDALRQYLTNQSDVCATWITALEEMRRLIGLRSEDATLPPCPVLHAAGFADKDLRALASRLDDDSWMRVRVASPSDSVTFEYRSREGEYIPFEQASAGQRATALMRVLLAEEGVPLIIDQPEDDLDNKIIHEIASDIWLAKTRRQLVFASHNANLVVNGDADLVLVFDYVVAGEQTSGCIRAEGAIDDDAVRNPIAEVMEGGKDAFRLRADKYGF